MSAAHLLFFHFFVHPLWNFCWRIKGEGISPSSRRRGKNKQPPLDNKRENEGNLFVLFLRDWANDLFHSISCCSARQIETQYIKIQDERASTKRIPVLWMVLQAGIWPHTLFFFLSFLFFPLLKFTMCASLRRNVWCSAYTCER